MASLFQDVFARLLQSEAPVLGKEFQAMYQADRGAVLDALSARGVSFVEVVEKFAEGEIPMLFSKFPALAPVQPELTPVVDAALQSLAAKAVSAAGSEKAALGVALDWAVGKLATAMESI